MYVYEIVEKLKVSTELKKKIEEIINEDDTYSFELQDYLQNIYKIERKSIEKLIALEKEKTETHIR